MPSHKASEFQPVRKPGRALIGALKGRLKIRGDIFSTGEGWRAELIAATSLLHNAPLLTRDRRIRKSKKVPLA